VTAIFAMDEMVLPSFDLVAIGLRFLELRW